ncbi:crossover junction endodeoxyribonuclease RusA [Azospirillaceae bacterium]
MNYRIELEIQGLPKITTNANRNWKGRWAEAKRWLRIIETAIIVKRLKPVEPIKKAKVTLTRFAFGRRPDQDNLVASFKHVLDGLVKAGVIIDDSYDIIGAPEIDWASAKPKQGRIKIIVEEVA